MQRYSMVPVLLPIPGLESTVSYKTSCMDSQWGSGPTVVSEALLTCGYCTLDHENTTFELKSSFHPTSDVHWLGLNHNAVALEGRTRD